MKILALTLMTSSFALAMAMTATRGSTSPVPTPLSADAGMEKGTGSSCQYGCNDTPTISCTNVYSPATPIQPIPQFLYSERIERNPHFECRFAWGADTCVTTGEALCVVIKRFESFACSGQSYSEDVTTTSTCVGTTPPGGGGS